MFCVVSRPLVCARDGFCNRLNTNSYRYRYRYGTGTARRPRCAVSLYVKLYDLQYRLSTGLAAPPAATQLPRAPSFRRPPSSTGAGRRSGSGWRQGRVRWGRPLLSRTRGAVGSGAAAVESAAVSAVALSCGLCVGVGGFGWIVVRFVCVIRVPPGSGVCARVSRVSRVCPRRLPPVSFTARDFAVQCTVECSDFAAVLTV